MWDRNEQPQRNRKRNANLQRRTKSWIEKYQKNLKNLFIKLYSTENVDN